MNNYYDELRPKAFNEVEKEYKVVSGLREQLPKIEKRLSDEKANLYRIKGRIEKLKKLSIESLSGSRNQYEKYKTSLKKLNSEKEVSEQAISDLETNVLPSLEDKLSKHKCSISSKLAPVLEDYYCPRDAVLKKRLFASLIKALIDFFDEIHSLQEGVYQVTSDFGIQNIVNITFFFSQNFGLSKFKELRDLVIKQCRFCGINPKSLIPPEPDSPTETPSDEGTPPKPVQEAAETPSDSSEGTTTPTEPISQAAGPDTPIKGAVDETSEPAGLPPETVDKPPVPAEPIAEPEPSDEAVAAATIDEKEAEGQSDHDYR